MSTTNHGTSSDRGTALDLDIAQYQPRSASIAFSNAPSQKTDGNHSVQSTVQIRGEDPKKYEPEKKVPSLKDWCILIVSISLLVVFGLPLACSLIWNIGQIWVFMETQTQFWNELLTGTGWAERTWNNIKWGFNGCQDVLDDIWYCLQYAWQRLAFLWGHEYFPCLFPVFSMAVSIVLEWIVGSPAQSRGCKTFLAVVTGSFMCSIGYSIVTGSFFESLNVALCSRAECGSENVTLSWSHTFRFSQEQMNSIIQNHCNFYYSDSDASYLRTCTPNQPWAQACFDKEKQSPDFCMPGCPPDKKISREFWLEPDGPLTQANIFFVKCQICCAILVVIFWWLDMSMCFWT